MGLDMYLEARKYVSKSNWKDGEPSPNPDYSSLVALSPEGATDKAVFGSANISLTVGYWRKANAIHKWFCDLDGGRDECQEIYVSREKLMELRSLCESVVLQPAMAESTLPPQAGFFFGSYEIDEWYMNDIKETMDIIDHVLKVFPESDWDWSFYYRASW
jgi:hypothetical protein